MGKSARRKRERRSVDEFVAILDRIMQAHEGPGHQVREEIDPESGDILVVCDRCQQILSMRSPGFGDLEVSKKILAAAVPGFRS